MKNTDLPINHSSNKFFLIAFGLLNVLAFTLLLCGLSLLAGLTISKWQFPVGCVLAFIANYYATKFFIKEKANRFFLKNSAGILGCIIGAILFCGYFYDVSYDGQWYHQEMVYRLKKGFNPVYQTIPVPQGEVWNDSSPVDIWCTGVDSPVLSYTKPATPLPILKYLTLNHFCKGTEYIETAIYCFTNHIETGKAINGMMLMASFFLCLSLFYKIDKISIRKKWILAALLSFNPITVMQLLTFCVDGNVGSMLLCLLAISCILFIETNRYYLFLLASIILVLANIKYTSLVYAGIFCIGLLLILLICKKMETFKKVIITGTIAVVTGVLFCGFNPYVTNTIQTRNTFYGLDETRAELLRITPPVLNGLNRFEALFLTLSAHQTWHTDVKEFWQIPKIPYALNKEDIHLVKEAEQQFSGFGPFFSGTLIISIVLFLVCLLNFKKATAFKLFTIVILIILSTVFMVPYAWWARYVPQLWLVPVIILCMAEFISFRGERFLKGILYLSLGLCVIWASLNIGMNFLSTSRINYQLRKLKALNKPVNIEYCSFHTFKSNQMRFDEWGIITIEKNVTGPYIYNLEGSSTRFETPIALPEPPRSFKILIK